MKTMRGLAVAAGLAIVCASAMALKPGETAPEFKGVDSNGKTQTLDPQGKLVYEGAIDDQPTPDPASLADAKNYVSAALEASMAGRPVETAVTRSYGCSVKYAN
jgi:hypothetical protein